MAVRWTLAGALALVACCGVAPANVLYNFNSVDGGWTVTSGTLESPEKPWTWVKGASVNEGGWQAWRGADTVGSSGSYLVSPCLEVDDQDGTYVRMDIRHRFDFGGTGTTPLLALGQVQYQVNDGEWLGIRTADFLGTSGKIRPEYYPPPAPFIAQTLAPPTGTYDVNAWSGTTDKFADGNHRDSQFTLDFPPYLIKPGDEIRFRFLVSTREAMTGTGSPVIDWEINKIQIDGVYECPEPTTLALGGIGGLGCLLFFRRRRSAVTRAVFGSTAATIAIAVAIAWALAALPARAESVSWNFQQTSGGWTPSQARDVYPVSSDYLWKWVTSSTVTGGTSPHWYVLAQGVDAISPSVSRLTSPVFSGPSGTTPATTARISIAQSFLLRMGTNGVPIATGQLQYKLNGGAWLGLPLSAFTSGGSILVDDPVFGPSPFKSGSGTRQIVNQNSYVAPNYLTPTGTSALRFISPGAAAFTGTTPGFSAAYVPSQAFLNTGTVAITSLQLRFSELNLGASCNCGQAWNLRFVQVDYPEEVIPPVPEPGALALGATGLAALTAAGAVRRRRHQRPSRPRDSP